MNASPVVIAVAITSSVPRKRDNPAVPITMAEQVEATQEAFEAGASLVHLHGRNDDETSSSDPDRFAAVQEGNIRITRERPAASNAERVARAAEAVVRHNQRIATPAEARTILRLSPR